MRPLRYSINVTLDGCCHHEAVTPSEALHHHAAEGIARADALLFGRVTYQMMEEAWRPVAQTGVAPAWMADWMVPFAYAIDKAKKYVVSDTLESVDWNADLIRGRNLVETVRRLKEQPGTGISVGGVKLPLALAEADLIDEYELIVHSRIAGHGPTLLAGLSTHVDLRLVEQKQVGPGAVAMRFDPKR
jgi:dihydrofolate reductase